ncbi:MAG: EamA family transporter, partial [Halobacteriovoraceae bacterium]|nr:EamA family transporter [Halobacteriovoraceae bacterium]
YARGIGTMVATAGGMVFLNEQASFFGWTGILLTLGGTLFEPLNSLKNKKGFLEIKGIIFTVLTGLMIGSYLVLDTAGVRTVEHSYEYISIMFLYSVLLLAPVALRKGRAIEEWKFSRGNVLLGSFFMSSAYAVILFVMQSTPVSYTVSARASGIILSALYGKFILSEEVLSSRLISITLVLLGVGCLAYA